MLAAGAATAWLGPRVLRPDPEPLALAGLLLLLGFAAWTGASLLWSVAPDRTWASLNRALAYALVVGVAFAIGSVPRAVDRLAAGWLVVATVVALYALAGNVVPGIVGHAENIARLRAPLEYWNALALVCVVAAPVALRFATARDLSPERRAGALVALLLLLSTLGMTYSRGGFLALAVAVVVVTIAGRERIPGLIAFGLAAAATAPVLVVAYTVDGISENTVPRDEAVEAGLLLGATLAGCAALLALVALLLMRHEHRARWGRGAWATVAAVTVALSAAVIALAHAEGQTIETLRSDFTEVQRDPIYDPGRLLTVSSGNRWAWWREASGAFADEPVLGWGAGSFPVTHRLYRVSPYDVLQPHSVPLQFLAETGVVGAVLGLGGLLLLVGGAAVRVRSLPGGRTRDLGGAVVAAAVAWLVHAGVDWDWDIPGVTLPVLALLGVVAARPAPPPAPMLAGADAPVLGRALAMAALGLALFAFAASAILPAWSDAKADDALQATRAGSDDERLADAAADAELAARLDPLSVRPLFAAAAVAERRGRLLEARGHLIEAVERQPYSREAWQRLTRVAVQLADREGVGRAAQRTVALDPGNRAVTDFVRRSLGVLAPPEASATATGTPLPSGEAAPAPPP